MTVSSVAVMTSFLMYAATKQNCREVCMKDAIKPENTERRERRGLLKNQQHAYFQ